MYCNKCGNEIKYGQKFCAQCGNKIASDFKNSQYINKFMVKLKEFINRLGTRYKALNKQQRQFLLVPLTIGICIIIGIYIGNKDTSSTKNNLNNNYTSRNSTNSSNSSTIPSMSDLNKITEGMTYSQVCQILGKPITERNMNGVLISMWGTREGKVITVYFNNSGIVVGKYQ